MATSAELMSKQQYEDLNGSQILESLNTGKIIFDKVEHEAGWESSKGPLDQAAKDQLIKDFASGTIKLMMRMNIQAPKMEFTSSSTVSGDASMLSSMTPMLANFNKFAADLSASVKLQRENGKKDAVNKAVFFNMKGGVRYTLNIKPFPSPDATATAAAGGKPKA